MDPRDLENKFLKVLEDDGFLAQKALFTLKHLPNGKIISHRSDFFGVWDIIGLKKTKFMHFRFAQGQRSRNIKGK